MLPCDQLEFDLRDALARLARQPLAELLLQQGILRQLAADQLRRRLCESVEFTADEVPLVISRLFEGLAVEPPAALLPGWIEAMPPMLQGPLRDRWDQIRLQKWMEERYRDRLDAYFLERREDLEQVVYGMIRLRHQGVAEELYLRLLDDEAEFGELARQYSLGDERFTRGLVGPMRISQPHPTIQAVLQKLAIGDLHPPFVVDQWVLLVRMEHRQPAQLNEATMLQLCQELLQQDLDATLDAELKALYPFLLEACPAPLTVAASPGAQPPATESAAPLTMGSGIAAGSLDAGGHTSTTILPNASGEAVHPPEHVGMPVSPADPSASVAPDARSDEEAASAVSPSPGLFVPLVRESQPGHDAPSRQVSSEVTSAGFVASSASPAAPSADSADLPRKGGEASTLPQAPPYRPQTDVSRPDPADP